MLLKDILFASWHSADFSIIFPKFFHNLDEKKLIRNFITSELILSNDDITPSTSLLGKVSMLNFLAKLIKSLKDEQNSEYHHRFNYWNKS